MSCADDKRGVRAFRRAKTACRLCNKFAGLQRALNGIGFARSFGYARGGFGYFSMFQRHVRLISFIIRQQQRRRQQADAMLYKFHVTQWFFFVRHHYYYYYYYYDVQSQLTAAAAMIGGAEVVHLSHK